MESTEPMSFIVDDVLVDFDDNLARIRTFKMTVRGSRLPAGCIVPIGEITNLVNVCISDKKASDPRDASIIGLLYIAGLRRAEVVQLQRKDLDLEQQTLRVVGKNNKARKAFLDMGRLALSRIGSNSAQLDRVLSGTLLFNIIYIMRSIG